LRQVKNLQKLKEGSYFYWGDNGGGRSEIIRRLTKEEINHLQHLEDLKYEIHNNQIEIQKYILVELTEKKNKLNSELTKHKKLMVKEGLLL
jgi:Uri superfamily endonuclease